MMRSLRTECARAGLISGSGLEQAKITGLGAIRATASAGSTSGPETPTNTSAPSITSIRVRRGVSLAKRCLYWLRSVRPLWITP
ncbi:hypothetical protein D3C76_1394070 [compost metagenome]